MKDIVETIQIEDVTRQGITLYRAVDIAAALAAAGFKVRYKKLENTVRSRVEHTWFCDTSPAAVRDLLIRAAIAGGPECLHERHPEHPLLAGLSSIGNLRALEAWFTRPAESPAAVKVSPASRLCLIYRGPRSRREEDDLIATLWAAGTAPAHHVEIRTPEDAAFCAAAITCGFLPYPRLAGPAVPHIHFADASLTFPGLALGHFHQPALPGTPAGDRHPFAYALTAALTWRQFILHQDQQRQRTLLLRSRYSTRTAMVSAEIYAADNGEASATRQEIEDHLAAA